MTGWRAGRTAEGGEDQLANRLEEACDGGGAVTEPTVSMNHSSDSTPRIAPNLVFSGERPSAGSPDCSPIQNSHTGHSLQAPVRTRHPGLRATQTWLLPRDLRLPVILHVKKKGPFSNLVA